MMKEIKKVDEKELAVKTAAQAEQILEQEANISTEEALVVEAVVPSQVAASIAGPISAEVFFKTSCKA